MATWLDLGNPLPRRRRRRADRTWAEIAIHGPMTLLTAAAQEQAVVSALLDSDSDLLLDLTNVTQASAVGIRMVQYVQSVAASHGRELVVVADQPELLRRFDDAGLSGLLPIYATSEEARRFPDHRAARRGATDPHP